MKNLIQYSGILSGQYEKFDSMYDFPLCQLHALYLYIKYNYKHCLRRREKIGQIKYLKNIRQNLPKFNERFKFK